MARLKPGVGRDSNDDRGLHRPPPPAMPGATKEAMKAAVRIETVRSSGSGVVVSPDGFVLTAAHVVGGAKTVDVVLADGSSISGTVLRRNPSADLALIHLGEEGFPCLSLAGARADLGTELYLIGSPGGEILTHTLTRARRSPSDPKIQPIASPRRRPAET